MYMSTCRSRTYSQDVLRDLLKDNVLLFFYSFVGVVGVVVENNILMF